MDSKYLEFLYSLGLFNIKLGLSTIKEMLMRMGGPHTHPRIIHIAGTNGKGSTLVTLEQLLFDSGYSTGSTISPHLERFNERFRINGKEVSDHDLSEAFERVCLQCGIDLDLKSRTSRDGVLAPTFFEFSIAIAFELFRKFKVDFILLETGLGGRLDATNIIKHPIATVITRIAVDHQAYLGDTLEEIALEKLGILKQGSPVFVSRQTDQVNRIIRSYCDDHEIKRFDYPNDFNFKTVAGGATEYWLSGRISVSQREAPSTVIKIDSQALVGEHQKENTATSLAVYHSIVPHSHQLLEEEIAGSLNGVRWSGRLQYLGPDEKILLDGAHNESSMKCLMNFLRETFSTHRIIVALGWKNDKSLSNSLHPAGLEQVCFLPVKMQSEKGQAIEMIRSELEERQLALLPSKNVKQLITAILDNSLPEHDLLVVTGSLYLVGEFLNEWHHIK